MDKPRILITPSRVLCASHGEHLRAPWPSGFAAVGMTIVKAAFESEQLIKAVRRKSRRPMGKIDPRVINQITEKMPLCYFVSPEVIRQAFLDANILTKRRCDLCGVVRLAGPYDVMLSDDTRLTKLVCMECMLRQGANEHARYPKGPPPRG